MIPFLRLPDILAIDEPIDGGVRRIRYARQVGRGDLDRLVQGCRAGNVGGIAGGAVLCQHQLAVQCVWSDKAKKFEVMSLAGLA